MKLFQPPKHRMQDLVDRTGFSERQIRFYIAKGLAPGAERKGPDATYTQATLDRLLLIRHLKGIELHPTGRRLTLEEMRKTIAALGEEGAWQVRSGATQLKIVDTDALLPPSVQASPISHIWEDRLQFQADAPERPPLEALGELGGLLSRLLTTLEQMAGTVAVKGGSEAPAWRRLALEGLEIQVREPANVEESGRLGRHAAALRTLLSPYLTIS